MSLMTADFHSHILPGIDDGSSSTEQSLAMLRAEWEQGIRQVVLTPHFYGHRDRLERFLERRQKAEQTLRSAMEGCEELPQIHVGAEVYYFPGISDCETIFSLTIDAGRNILIEMPPAPWTEDMYRELEGIYTKQGLTPVIAHIDRYIRPLRTHGIPQRLAELPVLIQANADFFRNPVTSSMALRMLRQEQIHLLGSDCHNMSTRKPNLGEAVAVIEKRLGTHALDRIRLCGESVLGDSNVTIHSGVNK